MKSGGMRKASIFIGVSSIIRVASLWWAKTIGFALCLACAAWFGPPVSLAADAGTLVEKDGRYVFVESMDPATKLLLERAVKQGTITQEEYDAVVRASQERTYLLQSSFKAWYDRGFNLSMNDNAFFLKIRGRIATRYTQRARNDAWRTTGDSKDFPELLGVFGDYRANRSTNDASTFNLRTARLYFMGHLFSPDLKFYVQLAGETAENAQTPPPAAPRRPAAGRPTRPSSPRRPGRGRGRATPTIGAAATPAGPPRTSPESSRSPRRPDGVRRCPGRRRRWPRKPGAPRRGPRK